MSRELRQIAENCGLPFIETVTLDQIDSCLLQDLPLDWAREQVVLPIRIEDTPCLLTATTDCLTLLQQAQLACGVELQPALAPAAVITAAIELAYTTGNQHASTDHPPAAEPEETQPRTLTGVDDLLGGSRETPVTRTLNAILLEAVRKNASDIHFEPHQAGLRVRYRIDGGLYEQPAPPAAFADALISRAKVMARMDISERRLPQDGMAETRAGNRLIDIRVATIPVTDGERVVMRLLERGQTLRPLSDLGMSETVHKTFSDLMLLPHGLVLVAGPTGSGKTTTLYSALGELDSTRRNILTVEDPVEYRLSSIGQIQVKPKIGLTFATGLRHILRQDPDVILVGETRDAETAEIAVRAALTGHLVFTTLHTNDAPSSITRLVDMGIEPYLLAACLRGVLAQRLVRKLCPECRKTVDSRSLPDSKSISKLRTMLLAELEGIQFWEAVGCPACLEGFSGRTGLFEMMPCPSQLADLTQSSGGDVTRLREFVSRMPDYRGMQEDGLQKIRSGLTSLEEVLTALST